MHLNVSCDICGNPGAHHLCCLVHPLLSTAGYDIRAIISVGVGVRGCCPMTI